MHGKQLAAGLASDLVVAARRQRALRLIYDLKFTFGMDDLARVFLQRYATARAPGDVAPTPVRRG